MKRITVFVMMGMLSGLLITGCGKGRTEEDINDFGLVSEDINQSGDRSGMSDDLSDGINENEELSGEKFESEDANDGNSDENSKGGSDGGFGGNSDGNSNGTSSENSTGKPKVKSGSRIEDQSFEVNLNPLGKVTFASYAADYDKDPLADAVFKIEKDGTVLQKLEGPFEGDTRANEVFAQVEAVSFLDFDKDGYDDIIVICSYTPASGPDVGEAHSEIRYYSGNKDGNFEYLKQMSLDGTSALAEITIETAKSFLGIGIKVPLEPWQQAYINYLQQESEVAAQEGYVLIYIDEDEIPELVEIGKDMATGCRIVNYSGQKVHVTQLNRLNFSYIEKGNLLCNSEGLMDYYYDLVFSIIDGEMTLIASGYYGAEDNSNVQFDESGEPIYHYEWNGQEMSKAEYWKAWNAVYDTSKAKDGYAWEGWYSMEEMVDMIRSYRN